MTSALVRIAMAHNKKFRSRRRAENEKPTSPNPPTIPSEQQPTRATAQAIIRAGQIRRGEVSSTKKPTGLALQIVNAGRACRGEPLITKGSGA
jgi:hypothetical protein